MVRGQDAKELFRGHLRAKTQSEPSTRGAEVVASTYPLPLRPTKQVTKALDRKAAVDLAPPYGRTDVKPAPNFPLRETVHVLREVVQERELRLRECARRARAGPVEEERRCERGDHRGRASEARLVHVADRDVQWCEGDRSLVLRSVNVEFEKNGPRVGRTVRGWE